jgi:hypothetical protein
LDELPVLINGDDIVFRCDEALYAIWLELIGQFGFTPSIGKNYLSKFFVQINSREYIIRNGIWTENPFVNFSLFFGESKGTSGKSSPYREDWGKKIVSLPLLRSELTKQLMNPLLTEEVRSLMLNHYVSNQKDFGTFGPEPFIDFARLNPLGPVAFDLELPVGRATIDAMDRSEVYLAGARLALHDAERSLDYTSSLVGKVNSMTDPKEARRHRSKVVRMIKRHPNFIQVTPVDKGGKRPSYLPKGAPTKVLRVRYEPRSDMLNGVSVHVTDFSDLPFYFDEQDEIPEREETIGVSCSDILHSGRYNLVEVLVRFDTTCLEGDAGQRRTWFEADEYYRELDGRLEGPML